MVVHFSFRDLYNRKGLEIFTREQGPNIGGERRPY